MGETLDRLAEKLPEVKALWDNMNASDRLDQQLVYPAFLACAAEIERLQCCGNCHHLMQHMRLCRLEKEDADGTVGTRECCAPCQFTPSCWDQP